MVGIAEAPIKFMDVTYGSLALYQYQVDQASGVFTLPDPARSLGVVGRS